MVKSISDDFLASLRQKNQSSKSIAEILDNPQSIPSSFSSQMRFDHELLDAICEKLQSALEWINKKELQLKLRGRQVYSCFFIDITIFNAQLAH